MTVMCFELKDYNTGEHISSKLFSNLDLSYNLKFCNKNDTLVANNKDKYEIKKIEITENPDSTSYINQVVKEYYLNKL